MHLQDTAKHDHDHLENVIGVIIENALRQFFVILVLEHKFHFHILESLSNLSFDCAQPFRMIFDISSLEQILETVALKHDEQLKKYKSMLAFVFKRDCVSMVGRSDEEGIYLKEKWFFVNQTPVCLVNADLKGHLVLYILGVAEDTIIVGVCFYLEYDQLLNRSGNGEEFSLIHVKVKDVLIELPFLFSDFLLFGSKLFVLSLFYLLRFRQTDLCDNIFIIFILFLYSFRVVTNFNSI